MSRNNKYYNHKRNHSNRPSPKQEERDPAVNVNQVLDIPEPSKEMDIEPNSTESKIVTEQNAIPAVIPEEVSLVWPPQQPPEKTEVVGVRFKKNVKEYYFDPNGLTVAAGSAVIVETTRGLEYAVSEHGNKLVPTREIVPPLRPVIRIATPEDTKQYELNVQKEKDAYAIGLKKIAEHGLDMKLVDVEYTFDNHKLLFYFTADERVDFRDLVKDLASVFRTRIELRQIGIRDEAQMIGGLGSCGRPFCCKTFLPDFVQVSIKMAKEQNLSLNSARISGTCGRLMCCLRYEHEVYQEEIRQTPPVDSYVHTADGNGVVVETSPLTGILRVKLDDSDEGPKPYHRDSVTVLRVKGKNGQQFVRSRQEVPELEPQEDAAQDTSADTVSQPGRQPNLQRPSRPRTNPDNRPKSFEKTIEKHEENSPKSENDATESEATLDGKPSGNRNHYRNRNRRGKGHGNHGSLPAGDRMQNKSQKTSDN